MDPITREEKLMAGEQLEPITRKEYFLAKAAGMDVETPEPITREEMFLSMISGGGTGGSGGGGSIPSVSPKAVNFYDYDGTCLYAYTVEEAQALTKMPPLPEREGLICQGWNWTLEDIKAHNRSVNVGATYITDDGTTRIYITLQEGRTSPMLGVCPNGTVTVDWGDGTEPDVLTGTSTSKVQWTPNHNYAEPGDYVIRLTVDGKMMFYGNSNSSYGRLFRHSSTANSINRNGNDIVKKIEIGENVTGTINYAFCECRFLESVVIPNGFSTLAQHSFEHCSSLTFVVIPNSVSFLQDYCFSQCYALKNVAVPFGIEILTYIFMYCYSLSDVVIPDNVPEMSNSLFMRCYNLSSVIIPSNAAKIGGSTFADCFNIRVYDFSKHTAVPSMAATNAFMGIPSDCEIRVPAALYAEWIAATNWATYASQIVSV